MEILTINKPTEDIKLRETYELKDKLSLFISKKKGTKMTYLDVKQKLLEYIKTNDLFDGDNKMLIRINTDISNISGYKENTYFNFADFDNFVFNCVNEKN